MAGFLFVTFYAAMAGAALIVELIFGALGLIPAQRNARERCRMHGRPASESLQRRKPREGIRRPGRGLYGDLSVACELKE